MAKMMGDKKNTGGYYYCTPFLLSRVLVSSAVCYAMWCTAFGVFAMPFAGLTQGICYAMCSTDLEAVRLYRVVQFTVGFCLAIRSTDVGYLVPGSSSAYSWTA
eukprot:3050187-Rhodomonas_salina.1